MVRILFWKCEPANEVFVIERTFISLFGGIGGFDLALQHNGWECVWYNDWDKYAVKTYNKNFGVNYEPTDITKVPAEQIPEHTLLCAGFPCQSFSIAGKRKGFEDARGTMFFEICRIIKAKRTPYLLLENVKGLLSHDEGKTFNTILKCLDELGYDAEWQVLNSKHFSVPQNRERVFIIANLRTHPKQEVFPIQKTSDEYDETSRKESEGEQGVSTIDSRYGQRWSSETYVQQMNNPTHSNDRLYNVEGVSPSLNSMQGGNRQPKIDVKIEIGDFRYDEGLRIRKNEEAPTLRQEMKGMDISKSVLIISHSPRTGNPEKGGTGILKSEEHSFTIDSTSHLVEIAPTIRAEHHNTADVHFVETAQALQTDGMLRQGSSFGTNNPANNRNIRRLTPLECERLQAFPDGWTSGTDKVPMSDSQRYKQLGNSVTVSVVEAIIKRLNEVLL